MLTKLFYSLTALTVLFLSLAGCGQSDDTSGENSHSDDHSSANLDTSSSDIPETLPGISMAAQSDNYPEGTESIVVLLKNDSDQEIFYGKAYALEKETDSGWNEVPFEEEMAFIAIAVSLKPESVNEEVIDLTLFEEELSPGRYRVVKQIGSKQMTAPFSIQ